MAQKVDYFPSVEIGDQVTVTIRRDRDSILLLNPPPLKVDDFNVEEKEGQWPAFVRAPGPGP